MAFQLRRLAFSLPTMVRSYYGKGSPLKGLEKLDFEMDMYRKYGLLKDDMLNELDEDIAEALERLPEDMRMQRIFRAIRAQQLVVQHAILPKEEWSKIDDNHHYLEPYLEEVIAERREREIWEKTH